MPVTPEEIENFAFVKKLMDEVGGALDPRLRNPQYAPARRHMLAFLIALEECAGKSDKEIIQHFGRLNEIKDKMTLERLHEHVAEKIEDEKSEAWKKGVQDEGDEGGVYEEIGPDEKLPDLPVSFNPKKCPDCDSTHVDVKLPINEKPGVPSPILWACRDCKTMWEEVYKTEIVHRGKTK